MRERGRDLFYVEILRKNPGPRWLPRCLRGRKRVAQIGAGMTRTRAKEIVRQEKRNPRLRESDCTARVRNLDPGIDLLDT